MSPRPKRELSRTAIAEAALALIDRHGLAKLSTRKLGTALGCEAMAIYWYYPNKEALLDAVVDRLISPLVAIVTSDDDDFAVLLAAIAHAYRGISIDHPNAFPLLATRRFASEVSYQFLAALFERARAAGISDRDAARIYRGVSSFVNGFALNELATRGNQASRPRSALDRAFPRVAAVHAHLAPAHLDELFASNLARLLEPLRAGPSMTKTRSSRRA